jgi:AcrR family transcriptional regulator
MPPTPRLRLPADRLESLLDAAADEFLAQGFRHGSIDTVVAKAGIGKATIYRHFADKDGLYRATVAHLVAQLAVPPADLAVEAGKPDDVLFAFAAQAIALYLRERSIALHRMVVESAQTFPDLAQLVHDRLTLWSLQPLKAYLTALQARQALRIDDVDWAARQFLNLATHGILFLMTPAEVSDARRRTLAAETVQMFIGGAGMMTGRLEGS